MIQSYLIYENLQQAKKILKTVHSDEKNPKFIELKNMLSKNLGYMGIYTKWFFVDREPLDKIKSTYQLMLNTPNLDKKPDDFVKLEDYFDYIQDFQISRTIKQVLKSLPSRARKLANDELIGLIKLNTEDKVIKILKNFYSKKGGKYNNSEDLINDTRILIENTKGAFNAEVIKKKLNGLDYEIIIDTPELLLVRIDNYKTSKTVGSKSWCISYSESMWNSYVKGVENQYFIWDFSKDISDKRHTIGATISSTGEITAAHWADDSPVNDLTYFDSL